MATQINYHTRLHEVGTCKCRNIARLFIDRDVSLFKYVVEKEWDDAYCKNEPKYILVPKDNFAGHITSLFGENLGKKADVIKYFSTNEWSERRATEIRNKIFEARGTCMCTNTGSSNPRYFNSGMMLIGSKKQMEQISHLFNNFRCENNEYEKLSICKVTALPQLLGRCDTAFNFNIVAEKMEMNESLDSYYTLVGIESFTNRLSFSFGKREWTLNYVETSYNCAKRELFEEFHIQLSKNIYEFNKEFAEKNCLRKNNTNIFITWLPENVTIVYNSNSKTIYVDSINV